MYRPCGSSPPSESGFPSPLCSRAILGLTCQDVLGWELAQPLKVLVAQAWPPESDPGNPQGRKREVTHIIVL